MIKVTGKSLSRKIPMKMIDKLLSCSLANMFQKHLYWIKWKQIKYSQSDANSHLQWKCTWIYVWKPNVESVKVILHSNWGPLPWKPVNNFNSTVIFAFPVVNKFSRWGIKFMRTQISWKQRWYKDNGILTLWSSSPKLITIVLVWEKHQTNPNKG